MLFIWIFIINASYVTILKLSFNFKTYTAQFVLKVCLSYLLKYNSVPNNWYLARHQNYSTNRGS